jgi:hypothetical protein
MKKLIIIVLIFAACNPAQNKMGIQQAAAKQDTLFLSSDNLKGKVWVNSFMANHDGKQLLQSFINDTVVKYYFGNGPSCWNENYTFWEMNYDCYKIYGDTIEYIAKLLPNPKNENKYILSQFSWERRYSNYKLFIEPATADTILLLKENETIGYEHHCTLTRLMAKKKITYPILLNK